MYDISLYNTFNTPVRKHYGSLRDIQHSAKKNELSKDFVCFLHCLRFHIVQKENKQRNECHQEKDKRGTYLGKVFWLIKQDFIFIFDVVFRVRNSKKIKAQIQAQAWHLQTNITRNQLWWFSCAACHSFRQNKTPRSCINVRNSAEFKTWDAERVVWHLHKHLSFSCRIYNILYTININCSWYTL